jgi:hypothetical protein
MKVRGERCNFACEKRNMLSKQVNRARTSRVMRAGPDQATLRSEAKDAICLQKATPYNNTRPSVTNYLETFVLSQLHQTTEYNNLSNYGVQHS